MHKYTHMCVHVFLLLRGFCTNPIIRGNEQHISWEASRSNAINGGFLDAIHSQIKPCLDQTVIYGLQQSSRSPTLPRLVLALGQFVMDHLVAFVHDRIVRAYRLNCNSGYNR